MKKKSTIFTYIKRTLLVVVVLAVAIVASVFFLDTYKAASTEYENAYEDSYWEDLEASGFVHYTDLITEEYKAEIEAIKNAEYAKLDCKSATYIAPYSEGASNIEKLESARYSEELEYIKKEIGILTAEEEEVYNNCYTALRNVPYYLFLATYRANDPVNYNLQEVLNNGKYRLSIDPTNTQFVLDELDENGNVVSTWKSNPSTKDSSLSASQSSQVIVTFVSGDKTATIAPITYDNYSYSILENENTQVIPNYYINVVEDENGNASKVLVYYVLEERGIDYTWFPETITRQRLDELFERSRLYVSEYKAENNGEFPVDTRGVKIEGLEFAPKSDKYSKETLALYNQVVDMIYKKDGDNYEITNYQNLPGNALNYLYRFFYEWCQYTFDDLKIDTGVAKANPIKPTIELALEYSLSEHGLEVAVPGNSIKANSNAKGDPYLVTKIDVLPYFTSVKSDEKAEGYAVIPDGSGAILEFDNQKAKYASYGKRLYSSDLTFTSYTLTTSTNDILLPMYAYVFTGDENHDAKAIIAEVTSGAAQVAIYADTSGRGKNTFNYAYYTINLRESQLIVIGTGYNANATTQYTEEAALCDYVFNYMCLDTSKYDVTYSGVAKFYRDLLIERSNGVLSTDNDSTKNAVVNLDILGSYSYKDNFIGIGYTAEDSLTTAVEAKQIISEVLALDTTGTMNLNVYYHGWRKEGLVNTSFKKIKVSPEIGGKKQLLRLINDTEENVTVYPIVEFTEYNDYQESFGNNHYTARDVGGSYSVRYPYELNSNVFNTKLDAIRALSPAYYTAFAKELANNYANVIGSSNLAVSGLGSSLAGNYRRNNEMFKVGAVEEQIKSFEILAESGITKMAVETPYAYAFEYVENAYDVPYQSTQYEILDYTVPFYQLVVNGLFDYSGESINEKVEKGLQEHLMRCIETGSNLSFTFTFDDSAELLQTNYNTYYFTLYSRWLEDVEAAYNELNELGIFGCHLVNHERLDNNVYRVVYENNKGTQISIILNYQRTAWNGVPAKSYVVE